MPDDAKDVPFPPMVLLPLVRAAAQSTVSLITIESDAMPAFRAIVRIEPAQRPARWDEAGLDAVRAALAYGFGAAAKLDVEDDRVVVSWPMSALA